MSQWGQQSRKSEVAFDVAHWLVRSVLDTNSKERYYYL